MMYLIGIYSLDAVAVAQHLNIVGGQLNAYCTYTSMYIIHWQHDCYCWKLKLCYQFRAVL